MRTYSHSSTMEKSNDSLLLQGYALFTRTLPLCFYLFTDEGNEFRTLEANLPQGAVHRQKRPEDRNATAVVDRTIQTLKKDLAGKVARRGGKW